MPLATGDVAPVPARVLIVFRKTFVLVAPVTANPTIADEAPLEERLSIWLLLILITLLVFAQVMPVTDPPVPVDERPLMVLEAMLKVPVPPKLLLIVMPVIAA